MTLRACQACRDEPARWLVTTLPWMYVPEDKTKPAYRDNGKWRVGEECHRAIVNRNIPALRARMAKMMVEGGAYEEYRASHRSATATVSRAFATSIIEYQVGVERIDPDHDTFELPGLGLDVTVTRLQYEPQPDIPPCLRCGDGGMLRMAHLEQPASAETRENGTLPEGTVIEGVCVTCMLTVGTLALARAEQCPACDERSKDWYIIVATMMKMIGEADETSETRALPFPILQPTLEPHVDGCELANDPLAR